MEVLDNGKDQPQVEQPKKTHEEYRRDFLIKLNDILKGGFPVSVIIEVFESLVFEMRMNSYLSQMEQLEKMEQERKKAAKPKIEIPNLRIPTGKTK